MWRNLVPNSQVIAIPKPHTVHVAVTYMHTLVTALVCWVWPHMRGTRSGEEIATAPEEKKQTMSSS